jgi:hypothetical protein
VKQALRRPRSSSPDPDLASRRREVSHAPTSQPTPRSQPRHFRSRFGPPRSHSNGQTAFRGRNSPLPPPLARRVAKGPRYQHQRRCPSSGTSPPPIEPPCYLEHPCGPRILRVARARRVQTPREPVRTWGHSQRPSRRSSLQWSSTRGDWVAAASRGPEHPPCDARWGKAPWSGRSWMRGRGPIRLVAPPESLGTVSTVRWEP